MSLLTEKLTQSERLCSRKAIGRLFSGGNELFHYPFRLLWMYDESRSRYPVQVAIAVPRKRFKKAVSRNRIRRLIREAYRRNKNILYSSSLVERGNVDMMIIYVSSRMYDYNYIKLRLEEVLKKLGSGNEAH